MNKDINLTITGIQNDDSNQDEIVATLAGRYYYKNDRHYLLYDEYLDNENPDTLNKNTITIMNKDDGFTVNLVKRGCQSSHMSFTIGEKYATSYQTPFGTFLMVIDTTALEVLIDVDTIKLDIEYDLSMNDEFISHNRIIIDVK